MLNSDAAWSLSLEDEGRGQVDRHGARAGGRVGRGAGMQRQRVEAEDSWDCS